MVGLYNKLHPIHIDMESLTRPHHTQCLLLCLGISLLTSGQTMTRITYQWAYTVLPLYKNSAQPNSTGVCDYLGGCILIEICQSASFCHFLFDRFKGLLLLWSKFEGCLFPRQPSQWFELRWQSEVWTGYCSWLNPESCVHLMHSLVLPPLILL